MATTTNYGWTTPDNTGLVKNGASDIRTLGSSIDTTTKALNPSTTLGDIEYRSSTANTNTRLAIGTTGQVLTVAGGVPTWSSAAGGGSMTLLHTITLSTTSHTQSSISQSYKNLYLVGQNLGAASGAALRIRCGGRTGGYIYSYITKNAIASGADGGFDGVSNDLSSSGGSACQFTFYDYAETNSEKLVMGQMVGNATGDVTLCAGSPFNLQTNISSITITTVGGSVNLSGTILIYGVN